jgi:hypothetical protein
MILRGSGVTFQQRDMDMVVKAMAKQLGRSAADGLSNAAAYQRPDDSIPQSQPTYPQYPTYQTRQQIGSGGMVNPAITPIAPRPRPQPQFNAPTVMDKTGHYRYAPGTIIGGKHVGGEYAAYMNALEGVRHSREAKDRATKDKRNKALLYTGLGLAAAAGVGAALHHKEIGEWYARHKDAVKEAREIITGKAKEVSEKVEYSRVKQIAEKLGLPVSTVEGMSPTAREVAFDRHIQRGIYEQKGAVERANTLAREAAEDAAKVEREVNEVADSHVDLLDVGRRTHAAAQDPKNIVGQGMSADTTIHQSVLVEFPGGRTALVPYHQLPESLRDQSQRIGGKISKEVYAQALEASRGYSGRVGGSEMGDFDDGIRSVLIQHFGNTEVAMRSDMMHVFEPERFRQPKKEDIERVMSIITGGEESGMAPINLALRLKNSKSPKMLEFLDRVVKKLSIYTEMYDKQGANLENKDFYRLVREVFKKLRKVSTSKGLEDVGRAESVAQGVIDSEFKDMVLTFSKNKLFRRLTRIFAIPSHDKKLSKYVLEYLKTQNKFINTSVTKNSQIALESPEVRHSIALSKIAGKKGWSEWLNKYTEEQREVMHNEMLEFIGGRVPTAEQVANVAIVEKGERTFAQMMQDDVARLNNELATNAAGAYRKKAIASLYLKLLREAQKIKKAGGTSMTDAAFKKEFFANNFPKSLGGKEGMTEAEIMKEIGNMGSEFKPAPLTAADTAAAQEAAEATAPIAKGVRPPPGSSRAVWNQYMKDHPDDDEIIEAFKIADQKVADGLIVDSRVEKILKREEKILAAEEKRKAELEKVISDAENKVFALDTAAVAAVEAEEVAVFQNRAKTIGKDKLDRELKILNQALKHYEDGNADGKFNDKIKAVTDKVKIAKAIQVKGNTVNAEVAQEAEPVVAQTPPAMTDKEIAEANRLRDAEEAMRGVDKEAKDIYGKEARAKGAAEKTQPLEGESAQPTPTPKKQRIKREKVVPQSEPQTIPPVAKEALDLNKSYAKEEISNMSTEDLRIAKEHWNNKWKEVSGAKGDTRPPYFELRKYDDELLHRDTIRRFGPVPDYSANSKNFNKDKALEEYRKELTYGDGRLTEEYGKENQWAHSAKYTDHPDAEYQKERAELVSGHFWAKETIEKPEFMNAQQVMKDIKTMDIETAYGHNSTKEGRKAFVETVSDWLKQNNIKTGNPSRDRNIPYIIKELIKDTHWGRANSGNALLLSETGGDMEHTYIDPFTGIESPMVHRFDSEQAGNVSRNINDDIEDKRKLRRKMMTPLQPSNIGPKIDVVSSQVGRISDRRYMEVTNALKELSVGSYR